jgi:hypothetical protein
MKVWSQGPVGWNEIEKGGEKKDERNGRATPHFQLVPKKVPMRARHTFYVYFS